jgi:hypothetical protein
VGLCTADGQKAVICTDAAPAAPAFNAIVSDKLLEQHGLSIQIGRLRNINKNPFAERAIQELETEILRPVPGCRTVLLLLLAVAMKRLYTRIRKSGLTTRKMSNQQIPISDQALI